MLLPGGEGDHSQRHQAGQYFTEGKQNKDCRLWVGKGAEPIGLAFISDNGCRDDSLHGTLDIKVIEGKIDKEMRRVECWSYNIRDADGIFAIRDKGEDGIDSQDSAAFIEEGVT